jgi:hypothetical protein
LLLLRTDAAEHRGAADDGVQLRVGERVEVGAAERSAPSSPACRASAATVRGSSPETTLTATPSARKRPMVSRTCEPRLGRARKIERLAQTFGVEPA